MSEELKHALALTDFGPCRTSPSPEKWIELASPMCQHCREGEDVSVAAGRILAAEVRRLTATNAGLLEALRGVIETLDAHDAVCYDCDRSGETYCDCLDGVILKARAAIAGAEKGAV